MILHFGINDIPYANNVSQRRVGVRRKGGKATPFSNSASGGQTTGDVAQILEDKYHVYETFYEDVGGDAIAKALEHSLEGAIENIAAGGSGAMSFSAEAESEIETAFKLWLGQEEMNGQPGVPTQAALKGINHRFKHPYAKSNPPRPSFIDTGMYQANFKFWTSDT